MLNLLTYDGSDVYVSVSIPIDTAFYEEGISRVDYKLFTHILKKLKGDIYLEDNRKKVIIKNNRTTIELSSSPRNEEIYKFSNLKLDTDFAGYRVKQNVLKNNLEYVIKGVSKDKNKIELNDILFEIKGDKIVLTATDGYRIILIESECINEKGEDERFLISSELIPILRGFLNKNEDVRILNYEKVICFELENIKIYIRSSNNKKYPDIKRILERESGQKIKINKNQMLKALDQLQVAGANTITFENKKNRDLKIKSAGDWTNDKVLDGQVVLKMNECSEEDIGISFRINLIKEGLSIFNSKEIVITIKGVRDFIVIRELVEQENEDKIEKLYLLLPCLMKNTL